MDELEGKTAFERFCELLDESGLEHYESEASACETVCFRDRSGEWHECWDGADKVNVTVAMDPEQAVSMGVGRREDAVVAHAYMDITPRVDWARLADELDVFSQLVRGFAEQVSEEGDE